MMCVHVIVLTRNVRSCLKAKKKISSNLHTSGNVLLYFKFYTFYFLLPEKSLFCFFPIVKSSMGWQDILEVCTFADAMSRLGSNPDEAINCHPIVSQAG